MYASGSATDQEAEKRDDEGICTLSHCLTDTLQDDIDTCEKEATCDNVQGQDAKLRGLICD
jgi:hypothetical protein